MKISHKELAACQKSPKVWLANRLEESLGGNVRRFSYGQALGYSIAELHKSRDLQSAINQLDKYLKKFTNEERKEQTRERLREYDAWLDSSGTLPVDSNVTINFPAGGEWHLGGNVSRVDVLAKGYRAVLFEPIAPAWKEPIAHAFNTTRYC